MLGRQESVYAPPTTVRQSIPVYRLGQRESLYALSTTVRQSMTVCRSGQPKFLHALSATVRQSMTVCRLGQQESLYTLSATVRRSMTVYCSILPKLAAALDPTTELLMLSANSGVPELFLAFFWLDQVCNERSWLGITLP